MLSKEDNELVTNTDPGTPMGELFRRFWIPGALSDELPGPDCLPVKLKILNEDLIAFRDSNGRVGLVDQFCPHRGASLFYARNEECGLRCIYHGWKYDFDGNTIETPNESGARMWEGKKLVAAYPTREACGVVWAYMGPAERMPEFPMYEWNVRTQRYAKKVLLEC